MTTAVTQASPVADLDHLCRKCYYSLRGNGSGDCPECGSPYNSRDDRTYYDREEVVRIREVALAQKLLLWAVLGSIFGWVIPLGFLIAIPFQLYAVARLARANGTGIVMRILLMLLMFVPIVSLIVLLVVNQNATAFLQRSGFRVGLMGVKTSELPPTLRAA